LSFFEGILAGFEGIKKLDSLLNFRQIFISFHDKFFNQNVCK